jgi:hypothetical protein
MTALCLTTGTFLLAACLIGGAPKLAFDLFLFALSIADGTLLRADRLLLIALRGVPFDVAPRKLARKHR